MPILAAEGAQVVGLNCDRGPQTMLPLIAPIREAVECAVAVQPVPYQTHPGAPTMETLRSPDGERAFPVALDPFTCTRFEPAQFALQARELGVDYVGICCGAGPHHVRRTDYRHACTAVRTDVDAAFMCKNCMVGASTPYPRRRRE